MYKDDELYEINIDKLAYSLENNSNIEVSDYIDSIVSYKSVKFAFESFSYTLQSLTIQSTEGVGDKVKFALKKIGEGLLFLINKVKQFFLWIIKNTIIRFIKFLLRKRVESIINKALKNNGPILVSKQKLEQQIKVKVMVHHTDIFLDRLTNSEYLFAYLGFGGNSTDLRKFRENIFYGNRITSEMYDNYMELFTKTKNINDYKTLSEQLKIDSELYKDRIRKIISDKYDYIGDKEDLIEELFQCTIQNESYETTFSDYLFADISEINDSDKIDIKETKFFPILINYKDIIKNTALEEQHLKRFITQLESIIKFSKLVSTAVGEKGLGKDESHVLVEQDVLNDEETIGSIITDMENVSAIINFISKETGFIFNTRNMILNEIVTVYEKLLQ